MKGTNWGRRTNVDLATGRSMLTVESIALHADFGVTVERVLKYFYCFRKNYLLRLNVPITEIVLQDFR